MDSTLLFDNGHYLVIKLDSINYIYYEIDNEDDKFFVVKAGMNNGKEIVIDSFCSEEDCINYINKLTKYIFGVNPTKFIAVF